MKSRYELSTAIRIDAASNARDPFIRPKQIQRRDPPKRTDDSRTNSIDLPIKKRPTLLHLLWLRVPIPWRPTLHNIRDINIVSTQINSTDNLRKKLPRRPNKRNSLPIFFKPRSFPNKHQISAGITSTKNKIRPLLMKHTPSTFPKIRPNLGKRLPTPRRPLLNTRGKLFHRRHRNRSPLKPKLRHRPIEQNPLRICPTIQLRSLMLFHAKKRNQSLFFNATKQRKTLKVSNPLSFFVSFFSSRLRTSASLRYAFLLFSK